MLGSATEGARATIEDRLIRDNALDQYMRMHKVLVGEAGAVRLTEIYELLKTESSTERLSVAGWAAIEAALVGTQQPLAERLRLFEGAASVWARAFQRQTTAEEYRQSFDRATSHRLAMDMAVLPLFEGVIRGNVTHRACRKAFDDCLMVSQSNAMYLRKARRADDSGAVGAHTGLAYECNALLALNRKLSPTWFATPAMARCDSGVFYRRQTHDLMVVHQRYGSLLSATPVEVKAQGRLRDQLRYHALLVRGRMHLSIPGKERPDHTLNAFVAVAEGTASVEDVGTAEAATERFTSMIRDYYAGTVLGKAASRRSVTLFHDNQLVLERHPSFRVQDSVGRLALLADQPLAA